MKMICNILNGFVSAIFPKRCIFCGKIIPYKTDVCLYCESKLDKIDNTKRCKSCGRDKKYCTCNKFVYRIKEIVSVYYYDDISRKGIFRFKFGRREHYGNFFAKKIYEELKTAYNGEFPFDTITYVPTDRKTGNQRGFDQCEVIAKHLSKLIKIPYYETLRVCKSVDKQHESSYKERFTNIKGKYKNICDLKGRNVLIIDDILTTGATLDECARVCLFSNAESVYCATVLSSKKPSENIEKEN